MNFSQLATAFGGAALALSISFSASAQGVAQDVVINASRAADICRTMGETGDLSRQNKCLEITRGTLFQNEAVAVCSAEAKLGYFEMSLACLTSVKNNLFDVTQVAQCETMANQRQPTQANQCLSRSTVSFTQFICANDAACIAELERRNQPAGVTISVDELRAQAQEMALIKYTVREANTQFRRGNYEVGRFIIESLNRHLNH